MNLLSTQQAAERLGIDDSRVRRLILQGQLPAMRVGRAHLINEDDLALVVDRKPGRPKKAEGEGETKPIIHANPPVEVAPLVVEPVAVEIAKVAPVKVKPTIIEPAKSAKKKANSVVKVKPAKKRASKKGN